ncbi:MAG TPA: tannase/feruloyl esterase family alpha/beta hydrolase, partial [Noviherbaspirillum sp.]
MTFNIRKSHATSVTIAVLAALGLSACGGGGNRHDSSLTPTQAAMTCAQLAGMTIPASGIGLATTGAVVTSATVVPAAGSGATAIGEYCRVLGDINPVDATAPKIKFQVNLPENWNRKAMMFGGGGYNGTIATGVANVPAGPTDRQVPL